MIRNFSLFLFFKYICPYIVLPVYKLKQENYISAYNPNSPKDIMYYEHHSSLFTEIEIGTPPQKIPLLIKVKENDYIITSMHHEEKNISSYYLNNTFYSFSDEFLENILFLMKINQALSNQIFVKIEKYIIDMKIMKDH